jgi:mono/diheme cytochrome c family protein
MNRAAILMLPLLALAACNRGQDQAAAPKQEIAAKGAAPAGPPPPPPYQMRPAAPTGNRLASADGKTAFEYHCGYCHLTGGMGTNLLTKQRMLAGEPPEKGLLVNRTDLTPDYIKQIVRGGKNAMPAQTRVDITDVELEAVAAYLGKAK